MKSLIKFYQEKIGIKNLINIGNQMKKKQLKFVKNLLKTKLKTTERQEIYQA